MDARPSGCGAHLILEPKEGAVAERIVLIRNPGAGTAESWSELEERVMQHPQMEVRATEGPGDATRLAVEARAEGADLVVAVGGDGTISEIVQGLAPDFSRTALGILPFGTGNDTIRSLGIPEDPLEALDIVLAGIDRPVDLVRVELDDRVRWMLNTCTGGFSAEVTSCITDEIKDRWGRFAYLRCSLDALGDLPEHTLDLRVDGEAVPSTEIVQLVLANGRFAGHGVAVAPEAHMDDGLLDVVVVRAAPLPRLLALVPAVLRGEQPESELILAGRGASVELELDPPMAVSVDGEVTDVGALRLDVLAGAGRVRAPAEAGPAG
ncbi:MAG: diacylglycerol kinase family lipid kinase [Gemmatimonadota bacterium]